jgi:hypothetical protein
MTGTSSQLSADGAPGSATARVVAVDLGASNGRVFVAEVGEDRFRFAQVHWFWNGDVRLDSHRHWDILGLYRGILDDVRTAGRSERVDSVGIDSWGVDYGLLDADGMLLGNHRDDRTRPVIDPVVTSVGALELYRRSGIAALPFNTLFQLVAARDEAQFVLARTLLLTPALLGYWLSGSVGSEETMASTTQLLRIDGSGCGLRADGNTQYLSAPVPADPRARRTTRTAPGRGAHRDGAGGRGALHSRRLARHRVRGRSRAGGGSELRLHLVWDMVPCRCRAGPAGAERGEPRGTVHQWTRRRRSDPLPPHRDVPVTPTKVGEDLVAQRGIEHHRGAGLRRGRRGAAAQRLRTQRRCLLPARRHPLSRRAGMSRER